MVMSVMMTENERNLNHLGGNMLRTICAMNISNKNPTFIEAIREIFDNISEDSQPENNVPIATFVKRKSLLVAWSKPATPQYGINIICSTRRPARSPCAFFPFTFDKEWKILFNFLCNAKEQTSECNT